MIELDTPVTIIGAGLVGPTLALDLGWRGHQCIVVDRGDGVIRNPRTGGLSVRTMEHYRRLGIKDRVLDIGTGGYQLDVAWCTSLAGYELARDVIPSMNTAKAPDCSPEKRARAPQMWLDPMVQRAAAEYDGVEFRYYCHVDWIEPHDSHVIAHATDVNTGEEVRIRSDYLVACDGFGSPTRKSLDIGVTGTPLLDYAMAIFFRCPNLVSATGTHEAERWVIIEDDGRPSCYVTVLDGDELWRLTVIGTTGKFDLDAFNPDAWVRRAIGRDDVPFEVLDARPWKRTALVADSFAVGRVLLAGDAVHTMSPTGGFGANTGIADATDLAWKLSAMLEGWGGPHLMESYDAERRPVAIRTASVAGTRVDRFDPEGDLTDLLDPTAKGEDVRARLGAQLASVARVGPSGYSMPVASSSYMDTLGVVLGYTYENSPICVDDGSAPASNHITHYIQSARPGSRAPHVWLGDGRSTLDLFGPGFTLLRLGQDAPDVTDLVAAATKRVVPLTVETLTEPEVIDAYESSLVLVRPDGHVAWRGNTAHADALGLIDRVRGAQE